MHIITKILTFDSAHRLMNHKGKCKNLHGHTYKLEVSLTSNKLTPDGMVVDFTILKNLVQKWVDDNLDHSTILNKDDRKVIEFCQKMGFRSYLINGEPTAENMTQVIYDQIKRVLDANKDVLLDDLKISYIKLWETLTSNCGIV